MVYFIDILLRKYQIHLSEKLLIAFGVLQGSILRSILYNLELKEVTEWLKANKLTLNVDKYNLVLFRRPRKKK